MSWLHGIHFFTQPHPHIVYNCVHCDCVMYNTTLGNRSQVQEFLGKNINELFNLFFNQIMMFFSNIFLSFYYQRSIQKKMYCRRIFCTQCEEMMFCTFVYCTHTGWWEGGERIPCNQGVSGTYRLLLPNYGNRSSGVEHFSRAQFSKGS